MYADEIQHYLENKMLTTSGGVLIDSVHALSDNQYYSVHFVGTPRLVESVISASHFRIYTPTFFTLIEGELTALFPFEAADINPDHCMSYAHVGQHGGANFAYWSAAWRNKKPLDAAEVANLTKELESIGYYVDVLPRPMPRGLKMSAAHARRKEIKRLSSIR